jgi:coenzyme F420-0:L-glutamate ligase/coenzyme F420-1:gamma-L-glutamate ligase
MKPHDAQSNAGLEISSLIQIIGLSKIPIVTKGDNIADCIVKAAKAEGVQIQSRDVVVVAQKIVSKSEGRVVRLKSLKPSTLAENIAKRTGKDPHHVEAILRETSGIVRLKGPHIIVQTRHGFVCANAGVDRSNVGDDDGFAVMLPVDPDRSARRIRQRIGRLLGVDVAVIISDTFGRAWRIGQVNVAVGVDGLKPTLDYRGRGDMFGKELNVTQMAVADEFASAAELVMRKSDGVPVAIIRGAKYSRGKGTARDLVRPEEEDLFR